MQNKVNKVDDFGDCGGEAQCGTCHVLFSEDMYSQLPPIKDLEADKLNSLFDLQSTSRLSCQLKVTDLLQGKIINLP